MEWIAKLKKCVTELKNYAKKACRGGRETKREDFYDSKNAIWYLTTNI